MKMPSITVGFRLDAHHHGLLEAQAERLGESVGDVARRLIIERLNEKDQLALFVEKLAALEKELSELRKDLALSVPAILAFAGKISQGDAKAWAAENLKPV
jgi:AAA+ superfamily predicted ATPase